MVKKIKEVQQDWVSPQNQLITLEQEANRGLQALAIQLGYDGSLTVGALEDEIRFYQRRTVEACLELGKRLLILKEITPHGEFKPRLELIGFSHSTAQRFMQAALRVTKSPNLGNLAKQSTNQSKFLELITLDDEDITELTDGGSVHGITLDDVSTMSVTELRKALREAKTGIEARDDVLAKRNEKIDELDTELSRRTKPTIDIHLEERQEKERNALSLLHDTSNIAIAAIQKFHREMLSVAEFANIGSVGEEINTAVHHVYQRIAQMSVELGIQINFEDIVNPSWAQPLSQDD